MQKCINNLTMLLYFGFRMFDFGCQEKLKAVGGDLIVAGFYGKSFHGF